MTIAALYIDPRGPYPKLLGTEFCWDAKRDARLYDGPHPVVAHPPCGPWGRLRHLYKGSEHDCAPRAVEQVRKWGGVLEHPAGSKLWEYAGLPLPGEPADRFGGRTIEVDQVEFGHVARKKTWVYAVRVPEVLANELPPPFPGRAPTHWVSGGRTESSRKGGPVPNGIKVCSAQQRRRTPEAFANWLALLADGSWSESAEAHP